MVRMRSLDRFGAATRAWFDAAFAAPTPAQDAAWDAIATGRHALVIAPTGSGKTLAAFLSALDSLLDGERSGTVPDGTAKGRRRPAGGTAEAAPRGTKVLYVSPLKALAVDVERNLRTPLVGIRHAGTRLGLEMPEVSVGIRSGDTTPAERRRLATRPPDILITTPESLFLMLTSQAREALRGVETVIVDEVHAVAGTKRGAHLALSLERLDALLPAPAQRIGLSATVSPVEEVARFLGGAADVQVVAPPSTKRWDLRVVVPAEDMDNPQASSDGEDAPDYGLADDGRSGSLWPLIEERVLELVRGHSSTIVFVNSRRLAERLTARLNELATEHERPPRNDRPAELMGGSGGSAGAEPVIARAHHGSVSKEQRALIEDDLKSGRLACVVATSSLELGIDMGLVDLVVQVESPPSVASGLQRVGRAGHQVGEVSRGVVFPKHRGELAPVAVTVEGMRGGDIEALRLPANPLDVLAQQLVAATAMDVWDADEFYALATRAASFARLPRSAYDATLDLLSGRYPSSEFATLRPRLVYDRVAGTLTGRPGSQRLAVTSGGTIPDRGLFAVYLAGGEGPGRRVGELDEEMVYESRVGDVIALGATSWRIEDITHDRVLVTPAPGVPGRLPFWKGDSLGRPAALGEAVGGLVRELGGLSPGDGRARVMAAGLDEWAADNLVEYVASQRESVGAVPSDRTLVVERCRDELGDWRLVLHSPYGLAVHAPWALAIGARLRERYGVDGQAVPSDDGIVVRVPDTDADPPDGSLVIFEPDDLEEIVTTEVGGSALFAARFRECAARALLLPRPDPGKRAPLWQQRQKAAQLLDVASAYPSFPIVLEAVRECLQDVYDLPSLLQLMRRLERREIEVVDAATATPSPFARTMLFGYVAQFVYEGDSPIAERRAAALSLDQGLLAELLGRVELRELLDPDVLAEVEAELGRLTEERRVRHAEDVADLLRWLGPLTTEEVVVRATDPDAAPAWLDDLAGQRRAVVMRVAGADVWVAIEDVGRLRDGLGCAVPPGVPAVFTEPVDDPLGDLVGRYARTHGPFTLDDLAARWGLGVAVVRQTVQRLAAGGRLVEGEFRPTGSGPEWCDAEVLRMLRRRSLARLRHEIEPVPPEVLGRFLPAWQRIIDADGRARRGRAGLRGPDGVAAAVEQLAGCVVPASALESLILPARVADYRPADLDELTTAGEVLWAGHGSLPGNDGWISLHLADTAPLSLPVEPEDQTAPDDLAERVLAALAGGGAFFFRQLAATLGVSDDAELTRTLWELVWAGRLTNDSLAPVRGLLRTGKTRHRLRPAPGRARLVGSRPRRTGSAADTSGRWALLPLPDADPTRRGAATAEQLLERHGLVTRGAVMTERVPGGFGGVYRVLRTFEDSGRSRRGYFVEGLGAAQFGTPGAVDRLRTFLSQPEEPLVVALAATDPANPYGAALGWPARAEDASHRPGRKAGAVVVLVDGELVLYVERGGRSLLTWTDDPARLGSAARALAEATHRGGLGTVTVERADGEAVLGSDAPVRSALSDAGFVLTPRGLKLRART